MNSLKYRREKRHHSKKDKKLIKLIKPTSETDDEGSEHELSYYLNDRVKMMKEVLKIIKPKQIRSMAPDCMKRIHNEEINSMLLEELLGISNKRLRYIFNGQSLNEESSSTDPEDQVADIISLDDISDDDLVIDLDSDHEKNKKKKKHRTRIKEEPKKKKVKKEKHDKESDTIKKTDKENPMSEKNLMSVLELLELQARARAIKSQLVLENKMSETQRQKEITPVLESDNDDEVIVESPKNIEIVITSSDSDDEDNKVDSFWKNSDKDKYKTAENGQIEENLVSETSENIKIDNLRIIHQTTIRTAQNNCQVLEKSIDNSVISSIPLPENSKTLETSRSNPNNLSDLAIESETSNLSEENKTNAESNTENNVLLKVQYNDDSQNEIEKNFEHNNETPQTDILNFENKENNKEIEIKSSKSSVPVEDKHLSKSTQDEQLFSVIANNSKSESENGNKEDVSECKRNEKLEKDNLNTTQKYKAKILNKLKSMKSEKQLLDKGCKRKKKKEVKERNKSSDDSEGIVIDLEQSEIDCINLD